MFELARVYLFVFGVLTIAGGLVGYLKAKSVPSLVAGGIAGVALLAAGYLVGTSGKMGLFVGLTVSFLLAARFVPAFRKTKKVMPAGLMAALSIAGVAVTLITLARM